ncbi:phosphate ABC transporter permease PstA [Cytophagaceae bacterium ABcell3]|nr:phosphate ABC transporter permease PstA [Cytophagaceae bacterium ABcell3]
MLVSGSKEDSIKPITNRPNKRNRKKLKKRLKQFKGSHYFEFQNIFFKNLAILCALVGVLFLGLLLYDVISRGIGRLDWDFFSNPPSRKAERAGIYTAWIGTVWIMLLTAAIAFPIGVGAGIYLEEYNKKNRLSNLLEVNIANLAGIPSIIYGLLGLEIFARTFMLGGSILTGALTLALLILPIIIVSTREAIKSVPQSLREGSYALGASKWQTIWHQVLPASMSGIITGVILAISRAIGETAPLLVIGALLYVPIAPEGVMDSFTVLPIQIYNWINRPQQEFTENAAAAIIVLLFITFVMNGLAVYLRYRWQKKSKWQ